MILCCGEALIDMLPRATTDGEDAFAPYTGGAVFNTAIALGRLGAEAGFFSGLSRDLFGQRLTADLDESGVDYRLALRSDRPTTLAFVTLTGGQARYAFYDENTAARMVTPGDVPELDTRAEALFFGCISLIAEPCGTAYETLMLREGAARVTMLDTNIRTSFVNDEAAYRARLDRMIAAADIVKFSDEDLHWVAGAGDTADLARSVLAKGPKLVCITEGARGATGYTRDGAFFEPAPKVTVADTVGAGDTFNAGLLTGLRDAGALTKKGLADLPEEVLRGALDLGIRAAAVTVSRAGANPPRRDEL